MASPNQFPGPGHRRRIVVHGKELQEISVSTVWSPKAETATAVREEKRSILQFMMRVFFIIYALHLISGPGCDSEVLGYSGGSVVIFPDLQYYTNRMRTVCRVEQNDCVYLMKDQTTNSNVTKGRLMMYSNTNGRFVFVIRDLTPQDAGVYRFRVGEKKSADIQLLVQTDACCGRKERKPVFLGENVTLSFNYLPEFTHNSKYLISFNDQTILKVLIYTDKDSQKEQRNRFSMFDDRTSKVVRVELSDVRKEDGVVYSFGAMKTDESLVYYSYFKNIQLQVTEKTTALPESPGATTFTPAATDTTTSTSPSSTSDEELLTGSVSVTFTVCVCVTLLLIGGIALTLKLRNTKRNDSDSTSHNTESNKANEDDGKAPHRYQYFRIDAIYKK
ncbi:uncharacterized protein [Hoplias malabaricus]|uniref:uncharacterized protein n=1 Tax=Hoplias malabaricus TaxID=27720 RepID=UPI003462C0D4